MRFGPGAQDNNPKVHTQYPVEREPEDGVSLWALFSVCLCRYTGSRGVSLLWSGGVGWGGVGWGGGGGGGEGRMKITSSSRDNG